MSLMTRNEKFNNNKRNVIAQTKHVRIYGTVYSVLHDSLLVFLITVIYPLGNFIDLTEMC